MRLAVMQPYFFPYVGYFQLMASVDQWVVFDTPQYIRKGWVNRNRILTLGRDEWKYIQIPIQKAPRETAIDQIKVREREDWSGRVLRMLDYYEQRNAPFYYETVSLLEQVFTYRSAKLSDLLVHSLRSIAQHVGIELDKFQVFSQMDLTVGNVSHPGQWALRISQALDAKTYINPCGGREIFDEREYADCGIDLRFLEPCLDPYSQGREGFVAGLSIIDVLMWNSLESVSKMLSRYRVIK